MNQTILVYFFEQSAFDVRSYTFQDKIKASLFDDLEIDFTALDL